MGVMEECSGPSVSEGLRCEHEKFFGIGFSVQMN